MNKGLSASPHRWGGEQCEGNVSRAILLPANRCRQRKPFVSFTLMLVGAQHALPLLSPCLFDLGVLAVLLLLLLPRCISSFTKANWSTTGLVQSIAWISA